MMTRWGFLASLLVVWIEPMGAAAQTASLGARQREAEQSEPSRQTVRVTDQRKHNLVYERYSWISVRPTPPRTFKVGDLLTIIVRERRKWEADADLDMKRRFVLKSELEAFPKLTDGGIGAAVFPRGKPNINYKLDQRLTNDGDSSREDRLTMRLTAKIIDVKPNGLLVLEGWAKLTHDDEISGMTITGTCRKEDVTADNTILSSQIADKVVVVNNSGALRAASSRGWLLKLLDMMRPI